MRIPCPFCGPGIPPSSATLATRPSSGPLSMRPMLPCTTTSISAPIRQERIASSGTISPVATAGSSWRATPSPMPLRKRISRTTPIHERSATTPGRARRPLDALALPVRRPRFRGVRRGDTGFRADGKWRDGRRPFFQVPLAARNIHRRPGGTQRLGRAAFRRAAESRTRRRRRSNFTMALKLRAKTAGRH